MTLRVSGTDLYQKISLKPNRFPSISRNLPYLGKQVREEGAGLKTERTGGDKKVQRREPEH